MNVKPSPCQHTRKALLNVTRLQKIIDLGDLRELMRFFYEAAGISVGILNTEQNWLVATGRQERTPKYQATTNEPLV